MLGNPNNLTPFEILILGSGNDNTILSKILKHFLQCVFVKVEGKCKRFNTKTITGLI